MTNSAPIVTDISCHADRQHLDIRFDDGTSITLSAELLRVESPSAEVQGHGPDQKQLVRGKEQVKISQIIPVGHYAVRIEFDDGHNTGIYSWALLYDYGQRQEALLAAYRAQLATH